MNDKGRPVGGPVVTLHPKRSERSGVRHAAASRLIEALAAIEGMDTDDYRIALRNRIRSEARRRAGGPV